MTNQDMIAELEAELAQAKRDAEPVIATVIHNDHEKTVTKISTGTIRTDLKGGAPLTYSEHGHQRVVEPAPITLPPVSKEVGKVIEDNDQRRTVKLKSGALRTDFRAPRSPSSL